MNEKEPYGFDFKNEAPLLSSLKKVHGEGVPAGYFDTLGDKIKNRIQEEEKAKQSVKAIPVKAEGGIWMVAASVVLLAFLAGGMFLRISNEVPDPVGIDSFEMSFVSFSDAEVFDALGMAELDDVELVELMGDEAMASLEENEAFKGMMQNEDFGEYDLDDLNLDDLDVQELYEL